MKITVIIDGTSFEVEIQDLNQRPIIATVDGERFEVLPGTELSSGPSSEPAPVRETTAATPTAPGKFLYSPLPGTVTEIFVLPGAQVEKGQPVCMIEAMKMKNTIRSDRSGTVAAVPVISGTLVKHKQVLVEFTD